MPPGVVTSQKNQTDKEDDEEGSQDGHYCRQDVHVGHGPGYGGRDVQ